MHSVIEALRRRATTEPAALAFSSAAGPISYGHLAARVGGMTHRLQDAPAHVGICGPSNVAWVIADLAIAASGRTAVPLPPFFSAGQLGHVIADSGVAAVIETAPGAAKGLPEGLSVLPVDEIVGPLTNAADAAAKIIYTSGSTGRPKGVILRNGQIEFAAVALLEAAQAGSDDRHFSVLPYPLLLENICGIALPILAGGSAFISGALAAGRSGFEIVMALAAEVQRAKPTTMVLVPELLAGWVSAIGFGLVDPPQGLRFVAVGGAPVTKALAQRAWDAGIPVHEGYGLSECCSVVSVNRPGSRKPGTVGRPLPGVDVAIENGEIVVRSPTVMDGYLGGEAVHGVWRTGDLGEIDDEGYLIVRGRKDAVLVLSNGRNVNPEWIEAAFASDPRISRCIVVGQGQPRVIAILCLSPLGRRWMEGVEAHAERDLVEQIGRSLPVYARPTGALLVEEETLKAHELLTANGRVRRRRIGDHFAREIERAYQDMSVTEESDGFL